MVLTLKGIVKYFGGLKVLDSVDMTVEEGKITALIGPNGAGKTTLFNIIAGVHDINHGSVYFKDKRIDGLPPHRIAKEGIARTFQITKLFAQMTVLENVMVGRHMRMTASSLLPVVLNLPRVRREETRVYESSMELLKLAGIDKQAWELAGRLPQGQQRLLEMARALATDPQLLLLDEPAAGLNFQEEDDLKEALAMIIKSGISILLVEHDMRMVMDTSDRVIVLDLGRKIAEGTPAEIGKNPAVVQAYLGREVDSA